MPKPSKNPQTQLLAPQESAYLLMPWSCNHHPTFSEIEAYLPITGNFEIIADIHNTKGVNAEVVARSITSAVNRYESNVSLILQMMAAMELCLECKDCLTWEVEHEIDVLLSRARDMKFGVR